MPLRRENLYICICWGYLYLGLLLPWIPLSIDFTTTTDAFYHRGSTFPLKCILDNGSGLGHISYPHSSPWPQSLRSPRNITANLHRRTPLPSVPLSPWQGTTLPYLLKETIVAQLPGLQNWFFTVTAYLVQVLTICLAVGLGRRIRCSIYSACIVLIYVVLYLLCRKEVRKANHRTHRFRCITNVT